MSFGRPGKCPDMLIQVFPPSRVTCTSPSSVPAQITFVSVGARVIVRMVLYVSAPEMSYSIGPPLVTCFALSFRVRSGLIAVQCSPPSVVLKTTFPPKYTTFASVGDTAIGDVQLNRYFRSAGFISLTPDRYGRTERVIPVLKSTRVMLPFCESTYRIVESLGAGTAYSPSPPATVNHSEPLRPPAPAAPPAPPPPPPAPLDGPHHALLSCKPPHTIYGLLLSAATM